MLETVLKQFGFEETDCLIEPFGNGLIHSTWLVHSKTKEDKFILQRINHNIFTRPEDIAFNTGLIGHYLKEHFPGYFFVNACLANDGHNLVKVWESYFRMFPFVKGSHTINVVEKPRHAFEAARQFALFTKLLSGLDPSNLKITLPDFHDLSLRYRQFENAMENGNKQRIHEAKELILFIISHQYIVDEFEHIKLKIKTRCTHHDTKISNILFNDAGCGMCVIDLDTVMPGYFISDVGDMMRTYLSPVSEEEKDFTKIKIRKEFYDAIVIGYLSEMAGELSDLEKGYFHFAGKFMIYMQAIRFLSDHLNDDGYYGATYEGQNFVRAGNQVSLLKKLLDFNPG
jgi:Ser/Thr protein kinase RdoA (MazF antagonist)